ncbi:MAG TPA: hypothetical protein VIT65_10705 [Microlunatus sp.]
MATATVEREAEVVNAAKADATETVTSSIAETGTNRAWDAQADAD